MFGVCLILAGVSAAAGIQVSIPQPEYEVARGDNVTLPCQFKPDISDPLLIVVSWSTLSDEAGEKGTPVATYFEPPGTLDVRPQFEKRITMTTDLSTGRADLLLTSVTLDENKVFECEVKIPTDDVGTLTAATRLVVLVAPSKPICKIDGKTEYGQDIKLTCVSEEGSPVPTYSWQRRSVQNLPANMPAKTTEANGLLSLFNISMETSGYYICTSTNKIRSASCNMTLTVMPPSMNIGSTAGIIGGCVAGLLVLVIVIYCCCKKKKKEEDYAMGTMEDGAPRDEDLAKNEGEYRDDVRSDRNGPTADPRTESDERSERNINRRDDYDERRERYDDRQSDYDERRSDYDERRSDYDDRRRYDDSRDRYPERRDKYDDRRDDYDDRRDRESDRRDRESDRRDDY
ncbi:hypothetical protein COCON_G00056040 [Conger conger]|uniref:Ig-like domain-containing protein n=1 Tax=Conger conger TaxID=82655 RepID=A0A9Q1DWE2_CONCO|nr:hypothetical protein COCON_G00056040 [Conger conger]